MIPQEIKNIENLLIDMLGQPKSSMDDKGQLQFPCPRCIEEKGEREISKYNLEVNLFKMVFFCWSCSTTENDMRGPLSRLIKKYGSPTHLSRYEGEIESLKNSRLYSPDIFSGITIENIEKPLLQLPSSFKKLDLNTCPHQAVVDYCNSRSITQPTIDKFNIGYTDVTDKKYSWRNRLIIPSYDSFGELNYFVGRDFTGKSKMKYKNCDVKKNGIIFQESLINWDADIVLVEGAIDCLRYPNTIALLGKQLTKDSMLLNALHNKSNGHIIVALDGDTKEQETDNICSLLYTNSIRKRLKCVYLSKATPYKDFSEAYEYGGPRAVMNIIRHAEPFNQDANRLEKLRNKII